MGSHSAAPFFVHLFQRAKVFPCDALGGICNFFRRTAGNDASALFSAAQPEATISNSNAASAAPERGKAELTWLPAAASAEEEAAHEAIMAGLRR